MVALGISSILLAESWQHSRLCRTFGNKEIDWNIFDHASRTMAALSNTCKTFADKGTDWNSFEHVSRTMAALTSTYRTFGNKGIGIFSSMLTEPSRIPENQLYIKI